MANLISLPRAWFGLPTLCGKTETPALTDCLDSAHSFPIHGKNQNLLMRMTMNALNRRLRKLETKWLLKFPDQ